MDKNNLALTRHSYANVVFSHKIHEVAAERKGNRATKFTIANVILISLVLVLLVTQSIIPTNPIFTYLGAGLTAGEIILLIVHLSFSFEREVSVHKNTALKYMSLRDRYKILISDIIDHKNSVDEIVDARDRLQYEYQVISDLALQTNQSDYDKAMSRLKLQEDDKNVWSDDQIDSLLPPNLQVRP